MVKVQRLFAKTNLKIHVCRTDKNPLGTKGRTSILSYREYHASCGAVFSVSRRKLLDRECCVTSFRQGSYTPLRRLHVYPLWTCWRQTVCQNRLRTASPQGIAALAAQGSVAPLTERSVETFSVGQFSSADRE